jgi:hypothetical protein
MGIVGDASDDLLIIPPTMDNYSLGDWFSLRFFRDICSVDKIHLSSITRMTRGYGKELYIHGNFGSRKISMSSKLKRDECMVMIERLARRGRLTIGELENY